MISCDEKNGFKMEGKGGILLAEFALIASHLFRDMQEKGISPLNAISVLHDCIESGISAMEVFEDDK